MERKNKLVLTLLIVLVMIVAMFSSFGLNFFPGDRHEIMLPSSSASAQPGVESDPAAVGNYTPVVVTTENIKNVVSTLGRPENYYRTITLEVSTGENGMGNAYAQVWVVGDWTRVEVSKAFQPMGTQYTIVHFGEDADEGTLYRWYGDSSSYKSWPVQENAPDLAQHLPTYEDVLALDQERIVDAGFVEWNSIPTVYVETSVDELGYLERYWISVDNGLLVGAETLKGEQTVFRMRATDTTLFQQEVDLSLPDGTVLFAP